MFSWVFEHFFDWEMYSNPNAFYLLLGLPLMVFWLLLKKRRDVAVFQVSAVQLDLKTSWVDYLFYVPEVLLLLAYVFLVFAFARPQDAQSWEEEQAKGIDIVVAMDLSTSMLARDFKPNRIEASKEIAVDFIKGRMSDRFALVVFAGESFTQCPLTIDHERLVELFDGLKTGILEDGTAIGSGLATAINRLKDSKAESKVIILLTDGENNKGDISPELAGKLAKRFGIRVYTIGVGKKGKAEVPVAYDFAGNFIYDYMEVNIDEKLLRTIANETGGKYFRATGNEHLKQIYEEIDQLEKTELASLKHSSKTELYLPFLLLAITLFMSNKLLELFVFKKQIIS